MAPNERSSRLSSDGSGRRGSKVERIIDEYGLDGFGAELEEKWTEDSPDRYSLRELAEYVNQRLVEVSIDSTAVDGEAENIYRLLTDDSVSSGVRTQAEARVEANGTDVEKLRRDFVSHQAVHTYLTKFRETTFESETDSAADKLEARKRIIDRLQDRLTAVSEGTLRNLADSGELTLGSFDVLVNVQVYCEDCETQRPVGTVLQEGGCGCSEPVTDA